MCSGSKESKKKFLIKLTCNTCKWNTFKYNHLIGCELLLEPVEICMKNNFKYKEEKLTELKKMSFEEAFIYFKNIESCDITSVLTNNTWRYNDELFDNVTDEEVRGLWTASGIYEDEK